MLLKDFRNMCLVKVWVHKTGFQWSTCTMPRHLVIMYLCTRAVDFASLNFWFWNCSDSVVCFVSRFIICIILLSVHYAKIVAMVEDVVLDLTLLYLTKLFNSFKHVGDYKLLAILSFVGVMLSLNKALKWFTGFGIYILLAIASFPVAMIYLIQFLVTIYINKCITCFHTIPQ